MYEQQVVEAALYKLSKFGSFSVQLENNGFVINIYSIDQVQINIDELEHLIRNGIIAESLRLKIANDTEVERNLILGYAFSNTPLVG
jgi:His-Xaa-Ser system protein HxsD